MSPAPELDELSALEARVAQAAELIKRLRAERDEARREASEVQAALGKLESERSTVRARIEKLLGQIDLVSSEG